jgi:hypothetical protein
MVEQVRAVPTSEKGEGGGVLLPSTGGRVGECMRCVVVAERDLLLARALQKASSLPNVERVVGVVSCLTSLSKNKIQ